MLKIGLTGGIGCGKSTIADLFQRNHNIPIIDADIIAHQLVEPGQSALQLIQQKFGSNIINDAGGLNRSALKEVVFSDANKKKQLENILHPLIFQQMQITCDKLNTPYCLLCIPLLFETRMESFVDRILVADCPLEIQIERVKKRDTLSTARILSIINSQVSREYRLSRADDVINNTNQASQLAEQVKKLHNHYLLLSNSVNSE